MSISKQFLKMIEEANPFALEIVHDGFFQVLFRKFEVERRTNGWRIRPRGRKGEDGGWKKEGGKVQCEEWVFDGKAWVPSSGKHHRQIRSCWDLDVFNLGYTLAMEIFRLNAGFPKEERYALIDQIRRSSRAVCGNLAKGFAKRQHEAIFKNSLNNSLYWESVLAYYKGEGVL
ncbi:MAG: four helix bundle protein [Candidatus Bathyarchaeia archaeon]